MQSEKIHPRRSFLFVPGTDPGLLPKAVRADPDIICIDLEDAVAPGHKAGARDGVRALLAERPDAGRSELLVRINPLRTLDGPRDLLALLDNPHAPHGLMLPKVRSADEIRILDEMLDGEDSPLRLQVIIETNAGLEACHEIARASKRLDALLFGGVDMAAELRVAPTWEGLLYARTRCVHAAAAADIDLIDVPFLDLGDMQGLVDEARLCAEIGMTGKGAIHPRQLPPIVAAFTPDAEQVAWARRVVDAFEAADSGLVVVDNRLIEKPVVRAMYRLLARAENV